MKAARAHEREGIAMDLSCGPCDNPINECVCEGVDREAEMGKDSDEGGVLASRWCAGCDRHYGWCECLQPRWMMRIDGKLRPLPAGR